MTPYILARPVLQAAPFLPTTGFPGRRVRSIYPGGSAGAGIPEFGLGKERGFGVFDDGLPAL